MAIVYNDWSGGIASQGCVTVIGATRTRLGYVLDADLPASAGANKALIKVSLSARATSGDYMCGHDIYEFNGGEGSHDWLILDRSWLSSGADNWTVEFADGTDLELFFTGEAAHTIDVGYTIEILNKSRYSL
jgi:hypothetical protein